jgi:phosphoribosylformylglycinamidine (FGAM) synthase-like amidotransferase family enzyme
MYFVVQCYLWFDGTNENNEMWCSTNKNEVTVHSTWITYFTIGHYKHSHLLAKRGFVCVCVGGGYLIYDEALEQDVFAIE